MTGLVCSVASGASHDSFGGGWYPSSIVPLLRHDPLYAGHPRLFPFREGWRRRQKDPACRSDRPGQFPASITSGGVRTMTWEEPPEIGTATPVGWDARSGCKRRRRPYSGSPIPVREEERPDRVAEFRFRVSFVYVFLFLIRHDPACPGHPRLFPFEGRRGWPA